MGFAAMELQGARILSLPVAPRKGQRTPYLGWLLTCETFPAHVYLVKITPLRQNTFFDLGLWQTPVHPLTLWYQITSSEKASLHPGIV